MIRPAALLVGAALALSSPPASAQQACSAPASGQRWQPPLDRRIALRARKNNQLIGGALLDMYGEDAWQGSDPLVRRFHFYRAGEMQLSEILIPQHDTLWRITIERRHDLGQGFGNVLQPALPPGERCFRIDGAHHGFSRPATVVSHLVARGCHQRLSVRMQL